MQFIFILHLLKLNYVISEEANSCNYFLQRVLSNKKTQKCYFRKFNVEQSTKQKYFKKENTLKFSNTRLIKNSLKIFSNKTAKPHLWAHSMHPLLSFTVNTQHLSMFLSFGLLRYSKYKSGTGDMLCIFKHRNCITSINTFSTGEQKFEKQRYFNSYFRNQIQIPPP